MSSPASPQLLGLCLLQSSLPPPLCLLPDLLSHSLLDALPVSCFVCSESRGIFVRLRDAFPPQGGPIHLLQVGFSPHSPSQNWEWLPHSHLTLRPSDFFSWWTVMGRPQEG